MRRIRFHDMVLRQWTTLPLVELECESHILSPAGFHVSEGTNLFPKSVTLPSNPLSSALASALENPESAEHEDSHRSRIGDVYLIQFAALRLSKCHLCNVRAFLFIQTDFYYSYQRYCGPNGLV
jgi:hypothetical protein